MKSAFKKQQEAIQQVEINNKKYFDDCLAWAETWIQKQMKPFTSENLKEAYFLYGGEPPREARIFGAIFNKLSHDCKIFGTGNYIPSKNATCHARPQREWISYAFRLKQQSNAIKNKNQIKLL